MGEKVITCVMENRFMGSLRSGLNWLGVRVSPSPLNMENEK